MTTIMGRLLATVLAITVIAVTPAYSGVQDPTTATKQNALIDAPNDGRLPLALLGLRLAQTAQAFERRLEQKAKEVGTVDGLLLIGGLGSFAAQADLSGAYVHAAVVLLNALDEIVSMPDRIDARS